MYKVKRGCVLLPKYGIIIVHLAFVCHHASVLLDVVYNFTNIYVSNAYISKLQIGSNCQSEITVVTTVRKNTTFND